MKEIVPQTLIRPDICRASRGTFASHAAPVVIEPIRSPSDLPGATYLDTLGHVRKCAWTNHLVRRSSRQIKKKRKSNKYGKKTFFFLKCSIKLAGEKSNNQTIKRGRFCYCYVMRLVFLVATELSKCTTLPTHAYITVELCWNNKMVDKMIFLFLSTCRTAGHSRSSPYVYFILE